MLPGRTTLALDWPELGFPAGPDLAPGGILDTARQTLGLDVLSFGAGEEGSLGEVKAGKYIADDIFVGVRQGATPQSTSAVVEVEVTDNITIKSENKATGDTSVGVTWEWEY